MKRIFLITALLCSLSWSASADDLSRMNFILGGADFQNGNYAQAFQKFRSAAKQGHPRSQFMLGYLYDTGRGTPQDYVEAYIWYSLAAVGGDNDAIQERENIAQRLTSGQLRDAQRESNKRWERIPRWKK